MAVPTLQERLDAVNTAIYNTLVRGAKKLDKADHGVEALKLDELRRLKKYLEREIAKDAGLPLFRVRSGLRELTQAGLADQKDDRYELSSEGVELVGTMS